MVARIGRRLALGGSVLAALAAGAGGAAAAQPEPWGITFQPPASTLMGQIAWFESYTLIIITLITLFVLALLVIVMVRFNARSSPVPATTSHNTMIEVVWTIVPVLILVAIAFPSFRLLYNETTIPDPDVTVKVTGASWFWNYQYMDEELAELPPIVSNMLKEDQRAARKEQFGLSDREVPRLLAVDYPLVVPVNKVVHVLTTSNDVNHAYALPAFGGKTDAIQGRLNESWFQATATGVYWGQCSELCGQSHAFMPIEIHVLEEGRFNQWVEAAKGDLDAARDQLVRWQAEDRQQAVAAVR
jgi:cytochrome c oxidase subunit 2